MVDIWTWAIGVLTAFATLVGLKVIDMVMEKVYDVTIFGKVWHWLLIKFKQLATRFKPIRIRFEFSTAIEATNLDKIKSSMSFLTTAIARKQQITFSPLVWSDDNSFGSSNIQYHDKDFFLKISTSELSSSPVLLEGEDALLSSDVMVTEDLYFVLETRFAFHELQEMLLNLGALLSSIKEEVKDSVLVSHFSNGLFTLEPIKGKIKIDEAIKQKDFEVSLLLKGKDKITIRLLPNKAQIVFPTLQIDERVLEYLKFVILNYYF